MLYALLAGLFLMGAAFGSFINVCVFRLPYEKSLLWPSSRCGTCYKPIPRFDNIPLLGYWVRGGRCRMCGASFSIRYFIVELLTGLGFAGLFYLEVILNVHNLPVLKQNAGQIGMESVLWQILLFFAVHVTLLCFLLTASLVDLEHFEIPLSVTVTGTICGLIFSALFPWPWPDSIPAGPLAGQPARGLLQLAPVGPPPTASLYPWPLWYPLPGWLQPGGNWQTGLATGLGGMFAGMLMLRSVRFVFGLGRGKEGLGIGDADLMMMAGAFIGWQPIVVAFFVSVFPALLVGLGHLIIRGNQEMPFGPALALGVLITMLCWRWIGEAQAIRMVFFSGPLLAALAGGGLVVLLLASFAIRVVRR
jgi:leader peptidase (prepilin peptidase)/N-methyltransferase